MIKPITLFKYTFIHETVWKVVESLMSLPYHILEIAIAQPNTYLNAILTLMIGYLINFLIEFMIDLCPKV